MAPMDRQATVLARKAARSRREETGGGGRAAAALWTAALPRAARSAFRLEALATEIAEFEGGPEALGDWLPEAGCLMMLESPVGPGVAMLDADALAALVEQATVGQVLARPATPRPATRTDATLAASLLAPLLEAARDAVGELHPGQHLADARLLPAVLGAAPLRGVRLAMDLGGGAKSGVLYMAWPVSPAENAGAEAGAPGWTEALAGGVLAAEVTLTAVLARLPRPIAEIAALQPGQVLTLPRTMLERVSLEAPGGARVARAKLGQSLGNRAVRLLPDDGTAG